MYSYIRGILKHKTTSAVVVENNGIGYKIFTSSRTLASLACDDEVTFYTYLQVREDELSLYGFVETETVALFEALLGVSGIGPKVALNICSGGSTATVYGAIVAGDIAWLSKLPGIGRKTAERLVLELKEKISRQLATVPVTVTPVGEGLTFGIAEAQALAALRGLGYSEGECEPLIRQVVALLGKNATVEEILRAVLRIMAQGR